MTEPYWTPLGGTVPGPAGPQGVQGPAGSIPNRLGSYAYPNNQVTDWNNATENGWYTGLDAANSPITGLGWLVVEVQSFRSDYPMQRAYLMSQPQHMTWQRQMIGGVWQSWMKVGPPMTHLARVGPLGSASWIIFSNIPQNFSHLYFAGTVKRPTYPQSWISYCVNGARDGRYDNQVQWGNGGGNFTAEYGSYPAGHCGYGYGEGSALAFDLTLLNYSDGNNPNKSCIARCTADWGGGSDGAGGRFIQMFGTLIRGIWGGINYLDFSSAIYGENLNPGSVIDCYGIP